MFVAAIIFIVLLAGFICLLRQGEGEQTILYCKPSGRVASSPAMLTYCCAAGRHSSVLAN
nr:hypothetical protein 49p3_00041 [Yersinia frederiksenii]